MRVQTAVVYRRRRSSITFGFDEAVATTKGAIPAARRRSSAQYGFDVGSANEHVDPTWGFGGETDCVEKKPKRVSLSILVPSRGKKLGGTIGRAKRSATARGTKRGPSRKGRGLTKPSAKSATWIQYTDTASGKFYYYNTTTRRTSWTRPSGPVALPETTGCATKSGLGEAQDNAGASERVTEQQAESHQQHEDWHTERHSERQTTSRRGDYTESRSLKEEPIQEQEQRQQKPSAENGVSHSERQAIKVATRSRLQSRPKQGAHRTVRRPAPIALGSPVPLSRGGFNFETLAEESLTWSPPTSPALLRRSNLNRSRAFSKSLDSGLDSIDCPREPSASQRVDSPGSSRSDSIHSPRLQRMGGLSRSMMGLPGGISTMQAPSSPDWSRTCNLSGRNRSTIRRPPSWA